MAEEIRDDLTSILIEKKKGAWGDEGCLKYNFTLPSELTVTITLDEYRALVKKDATRNEAIEKKEKERMDYYFENEKLKKEIASLKEKLLKYVTEEQTEAKKEGGLTMSEFEKRVQAARAAGLTMEEVEAAMA